MSNAPTPANPIGGADPDPSTIIGSLSGDYITGDKILGDQIIHQHHADQRYDVQGLPCPFLGLNSFTSDDRARYAGREHESISALQLLVMPGEERPLLMITGASGSGKSSFAQAGVLPALEEHYSRRGCWLHVATFRPSKQPLAGLRDALTQLGLRPADAPLTPALLASTLRDQTPAEQMNLVLIDQFEELYTQSSPDEREELLLLLERLPPVKESRTHWLLTMRADFLGEIFSRPALYQLAKSGLELRTISEAALQRAIIKPVQLLYPNGEKQLEPALIKALARDAAQDASYLPLLQMTLYALWAGGSLRLANYTTLSAVLETWGDDVVQWNDYASGKFHPRPPEDQERIWEILLALVDVGNDAAQRDVRRRRLRHELTRGNPNLERLIADLATARLLSTGMEVREGGEVQTVDLSHEALLHPEHGWQALRSAVDNQRQLLRRRDRFEELLADWLTAAEGVRPQLLLHGLYLEEALALRSAEDIATRSPAAAALIDASVAARDRAHEQELARARALADEQARRADSEHRRTQLLRRAAMGLISLLAFTLVAMFFAITQWTRATQEAAHRATAQQEAQYQQQEALAAAADAEHRRVLAVSQSLSFAAQDRLITAPETARLLSYEAIKLNPNRLSESILHASIGEWSVTPIYGHTKRVQSASFSPDGQQILTASEDGTARLWSLDGQAIKTVQGPMHSVFDAQFSPDGQHILTISSDGMARLWSINGQLITTIQGAVGQLHEPTVSTDEPAESRPARLLNATFSPDGQHILTAAEDGRIRLWSLSGQRLVDYTGVSRTTTSATWSPDGRHVMSVGSDGSVWIWSADGKSSTQLKQDGVTALNAAFSPDSTHIVVSLSDHTAQLIDLDGKVITSFKGHVNAITSISVSPDGKLLLTVSSDDTIRVWSVDGRLITILQGHTDWIQYASFSPDSKYVLSASNDETARVWFLDGTTMAILQGHDRTVTNAVFSPDGESILTASDDNTARLWKQDLQAFRFMKGHSGTVTSAVFSPDGQSVLTASADDTARLWSHSGKIVTTFTGHQGGVTRAVFSPNGQRVLTASHDRTARLWTLDGQLLISYQGHNDAVLDASFSPDGLHVLTVTDDREAWLWTSDGQRLAIFRGLKQDVVLRIAKLSPDGQHVIIGYSDGSARLWTYHQQLVATLEGHTAAITGIDVSASGKTILTTSADHTAQLWSSTGKHISTLKGHTELLWESDFSPGEQLLLTASHDGTARLWGTDGRPLVTFEGHSRDVYYAAFSPNGKYILTASFDGEVRLWSVDGHLLTIISKYTSPTPRAEFSPDSNYLLLTGPDYTAWMYPISIDDLLTITACQVGRGLRQTEITRFQIPSPLAFNFEQRQCPPVLQWQK